MKFRHSRNRLLAALIGGFVLAGCGSAPDRDQMAEGAPAVLEAEFFQERWEAGGGTLLIRALDGAFIWDNRAALEPGNHEILFEYEVTMTCARATGCAVWRTHDRIGFEAEAGESYRLRAERQDDAVRAWVERAGDGAVVASRRANQLTVEHEGYPNEAWRGLCTDAERGDAKARRAIGLHYWRGWWPARRDVVLAYQWLSLASQANDSAAPAFREMLTAEMTGAQIAEGKRRVERWRPGACVTEAKLSATGG